MLPNTHYTSDTSCIAVYLIEKYPRLTLDFVRDADLVFSIKAQVTRKKINLLK